MSVHSAWLRHRVMHSSPAAQDQTILKNPKKVKQFLETHNIPYEPETPDHVLRGKARARMKRIAEQGISPEAKKMLFTKGADSKGMSIKEFKEYLQAMAHEGVSVDKHKTVCFSFQDLPYVDELTVTKHAFQGACTGRVKNSRCTKCNDFTTGIIGYSFKAVVADVEDENVKLIVHCAKKECRRVHVRLDCRQLRLPRRRSEERRSRENHVHSYDCWRVDQVLCRGQ